MFNKVWGTAAAFLILMMQTFGCYHLAGGCRAPSSWGVEGRTSFFKLGSDSRRKKEAGVLGGPEVRAAQQHYAHRYHPSLLFVPQRCRCLQMPLERAPGPGARFLSLPPLGANHPGRASGCAPAGPVGNLLCQRAGPLLRTPRCLNYFS